MKEDYFSQLDYYDESFCEQQYTYGPCFFVCFVKFKSLDQFNPSEPPQILDIYSVVVLRNIGFHGISVKYTVGDPRSRESPEEADNVSRFFI